MRIHSAGYGNLRDDEYVQSQILIPINDITVYIPNTFKTVQCCYLERSADLAN